MNNKHRTPQAHVRHRYSMELLRELNEEYRTKPFVASFAEYTDKFQETLAANRIRHLTGLMDLPGKRVLEVGCGGGYMAHALARKCDCAVTGIDIYESPIWAGLKAERLDFQCLDLSESNPLPAESFDVILSFAAWEHMRHPFEVLRQCAGLLKTGGFFYLVDPEKTFNIMKYMENISEILYRFQQGMQ